MKLPPCDCGNGLPPSYVDKAKRSGRASQIMSADYAVWLVTVKGLRPAVVPGSFTTCHLDKLPNDERVRWLKTSRRRWLAKKRKAGKK